MSGWKCLQCGEPTGNVRSYCATCQQTQLLSSMIKVQNTTSSSYVIISDFDPKNPWHWIRDFFKLLIVLPLIAVGLFSVYFCASIIWACIKVVL